MNHDEVLLDLDAYLDGELDEARARELAAHVESCEACRRELDELRRARSMVSSLGRASAPGDLVPKVQRTIEARSMGRFYSGRASQTRIPYETIAVVILLLLVSIMALALMDGARDFKAPTPAICPDPRERRPGRLVVRVPPSRPWAEVERRATQEAMRLGLAPPVKGPGCLLVRTPGGQAEAFLEGVDQGLARVVTTAGAEEVLLVSTD